VGDEKILLGVTPDAISFLTVLNQTRRDSALPGFSVEKPKPIADQTTKNQSLASARIREPAVLNQSSDTFEDVLSDDKTISLKETPRLKKIAGNDEETLKGSKKPPVTDRPTAGAARGQRINIGVDDAGARPMGRSRPRAAEPSPEAIEDVTRLIREKLKNLKSI
jgi:hypothetical protein